MFLSVGVFVVHVTLFRVGGVNLSLILPSYPNQSEKLHLEDKLLIL